MKFTPSQVIEMRQQADDAATAQLQCEGEFHPDWQEVADGLFATLAADRALESQAARIAELEAEIANLHTTMMAAAVEINEHWDAHCDAEGYGPTNLMHRLERGIASQYGYDAKTLARVEAERDQLRAEVQHHIVTREQLLLTLTSIHALMYPPPIKTPDGRTMVFRPNDPDPHTILQALSDRIRDIPDTIDRAIEAAKEAK